MTIKHINSSPNNEPDNKSTYQPEIIANAGEYHVRYNGLYADVYPGSTQDSNDKQFPSLAEAKQVAQSHLESSLININGELQRIINLHTADDPKPLYKQV